MHIIKVSNSLRVSSSGSFGGRAGKGRRACNFITGISIFSLKKLSAELTGSHSGIRGGIQIPEMLFQALLPFLTLPPERPGELACRLEYLCLDD